MAAITSNGTGGGNSNVGGSWAGGVSPIDGDSVTIVAGDIVTLIGVNAWGDDTATAVRVSGKLSADRTANCSLSIRGDIRWLNGGERDFGSIASPILWPITCTILPNRSAVPAGGKWNIRADNGAKLSDVGSPATRNTQITSASGVVATGTTFDVADATGWQLGAKIVIGQTDAVLAHTETGIIFSITPTVGTAATIVLTAGVAYTHVQFARVGYLWSNVVYRAYHGAAYPFRVHQTGGSLTPAGSRNIRDVLLDAVQAGLTFADMIRDDASSTNAWGIIDSISLDNVNASGISIFGNIYPKVISNIAAYGSALQSGWYPGYGFGITFNDCISYGSAGFALSMASVTDIIHNRCEFIHSVNGTMDLNGVAESVFNDCKLHSSSGPLIGRGSNTAVSVMFNSCSIGSSDLPGTTTAAGGVTGLSGSLVQWTLTNCKFKSSGLGYVLNYSSYSSYVKIANKDINPLIQEVYYRQGVLVRDNTSKLSGITSLKLSPTSATSPMDFIVYIPAPNNKSVGVSGVLFLDTANPTTVTLSGLGITPSVYTMTTTGVNEPFFIHGMQTTGTDGILTVTISTQGTTGNLWVDALSAPQAQAIDFGELNFWTGALPVSLITANYSSGGDVWNSLITNYALTGSFGALLSNYIDAAVSSRLATTGYISPSGASVNVTKVNGITVQGSGVTLDPWRPV